MRLLLVSDAWEPQVNGVVRTLRSVVRELEQRGDQVQVVHPALFRTLPCPTYPEVRLALWPGRALARMAERFEPEAVHVATEGPLGLAARRLCLRRGWPFTTSFHTRFAEYVARRAPIPEALTWRGLRWFHSAAERTLAPTETLARELEARGFREVVRWSRGVDAQLFRPRASEVFAGLPRPIWLSVGRVAVEKNLAAFLALRLEGTQVVVGDGPQRAELERRFPRARFLGALHGEELALHFAGADAFVFPSRTDTYGLVMLEALACGLPVAAFPVPGPLDVLVHEGPEAVGALDEDLAAACVRALALPRERCRAFALQRSWSACAQRFASALAPLTPASSVPAPPQSAAPSEGGRARLSTR